MKLGILGTGMIINMALPSLNQLGIEKKAILTTERSLEKAKKLARENNIKEVYTSLDELLASDLDTVYIGLPNAMHYETAKKSLEAGKHVILEKPAVSTLKEMEQLAALAREKGLILAEAVTLHYMPAIKLLKEKLSSIGRIRLFIFNFSQYSSRYDRFKTGDIAPAFDPACSGGSFMDINVYNINTAFALFGIPHRMFYLPNIERNIDTSGIAALSYPDFQGVCVGAKDCSAPNISTIQGTDGTIVIPESVSVMTRFSIEYRNGKKEEFSIEHPEDRMLYEFQTFQKWIDGKDLKAADEMLELSIEIVKAMEEARKKADIIFPADLS